jgi:hypothetical protein
MKKGMPVIQNHSINTAAKFETPHESSCVFNDKIQQVTLI